MVDETSLLQRRSTPRTQMIKATGVGKGNICMGRSPRFGGAVTAIVSYPGDDDAAAAVLPRERLPGRPSSVHGDHRPRDERGGVAGEEQSHLSDLLGLADPMGHRLRLVGT